MRAVEMNAARIDPKILDGRVETEHERWAHCHVNWTAVWIGVLATFGVLLLFGLVGVALGAHLTGPEHRLVDLKKLGVSALIFSVCAAFFSAVVGGWAAVRIAGILHAEPAMLHGAFVWLVTLPMLVVSAGIGASSILGGWYNILGPNSNMPFSHPTVPSVSPTPDEIATYKINEAEYERNVKQWNEDTPKVTRNSALVGMTALLLGLVGSAIGGWMACGEPMNFTHYRTRKPRYHVS